GPARSRSFQESLEEVLPGAGAGVGQHKPWGKTDGGLGHFIQAVEKFGIRQSREIQFPILSDLTEGSIYLRREGSGQLQEGSGQPQEPQPALSRCPAVHCPPWGLALSSCGLRRQRNLRLVAAQGAVHFRWWNAERIVHNPLQPGQVKVSASRKPPNRFHPGRGLVTRGGDGGI